MPVKCRQRSRLIGSKIRDEMEIVTARLESSLTLQCHYCDEEDDGIPKMWYYIDRFSSIYSVTPTEVDLTHGELTRGGYSMLPDHSLVIERVKTSHTGYYLCHGINFEDSEYKYNFKVDVIEQPIEIVTGDVEDWKEYAEYIYSLVNEQIAALFLHEDVEEHKHRVRFHALPEWMPWSPCNGCLGLKSKVAECRLVPSSYNSTESRIRNINKARSKSATTTANHSEESTTTCEPPLDLLGNNTKAQFLLKEYEIACQSLALAEASPLIHKKASQAKPFVITAGCNAPCKHPSGGPGQPKYRNTISLQEGDHITLVCPESTMASHVVWRKDGIQIEKHTFTENDMEEHILVDTFSNLYITYAREEESGNYTCYVNGAKIQEVIVIVNAEAVIKHAAFIRHIHYLGFMLMFGVIFYVAGVIVAWTQRHTFKQIDFEKLKDPDQNFGKGLDDKKQVHRSTSRNKGSRKQLIQI
ncbi:hypothetical protein GE061_005985 [Apolygus lucorum]|uniref:Ig-like domain-containing protein n=1 Tax=Apolygus lucorum TaxID=248454 RepID=A0A8S9WSP7_APOLU|nr:hypothetical protein GE061_005985 [Apolygus lucorum]